MNGRPRTRTVRVLLSRRAAQRRLAAWGITMSLPVHEKQGMWVNVPRMKTDTLCHIAGVVFKHLDAPYIAGRPASGGTQRKFKLTASATCRVATRNSSKRSVSLELTQGDRWVGVGNVTIPANYPIPEVGALCEVEYLYAFRGGSLFQPVHRGVRDDLTLAAASLTQLKYKPEANEDDES